VTAVTVVMDAARRSPPTRQDELLYALLHDVGVGLLTPLGEDQGL
jgi:hypothetical protein